MRLTLDYDSPPYRHADGLVLFGESVSSCAPEAPEEKNSKTAATNIGTPGGRRWAAQGIMKVTGKVWERMAQDKHATPYALACHMLV